MVVNIIQTFDSQVSLSQISLIDADTSLYYYLAEEGQVGISDGTTAGTEIFSEGNPFTGAKEIIGANGRLFFDGFSTETGEEPYRSDGTPKGTIVLQDININPSESSEPLNSNFNFIKVEDSVYFTANDGENGTALYVSDGTQQGTRLVADISDGTSNPFDDQFIDFNNNVGFRYSSRRKNENKYFQFWFKS